MNRLLEKRWRHTVEYGHVDVQSAILVLIGPTFERYTSCHASMVACSICITRCKIL